MGGAENQVVNLADELAARGHKVTLAYLVKPALVEPSNKQIKVVWLGGSKTFFGMVKAYINLAKLIKQIKPNVVHSHMFHANLMTRLVRLISKVTRLVCTAHSNNEGGKVRMLAYRLTDKMAHEFTNVSKGAVLSFENKKAAPIGRMSITHNGIDTERFRFKPILRHELRARLDIQHCKVFISIGRFNEAKDYPNLLDAFSKVISCHANLHLLIVGDGELRSKIQHKIQELSLEESVSLLGVRRDIPELLSAADVFVLPSSWEGFGLVVAEAMACERVVIATDSGGVAEVLGDSGFLIPPRDSTALASAMQAALNLSSDMASKFGLSARQRVVENFSLDSAVERWLKIYE
jgi:glycosyltransferase involved in cell wall biosynthesis